MKARVDSHNEKEKSVKLELRIRTYAYTYLKLNFPWIRDFDSQTQTELLKIEPCGLARSHFPVSEFFHNTTSNDLSFLLYIHF